MTIPSEVLKNVRRIEITAGHLVNDLFAGQYSSTFKGRGMEFSEVREYIPGDDVRSIDWNVTARAGHPYIKKFIEERELTVLFLVDISRSQMFGSRGKLKSNLAAEITALLALSALKNNDKAGMILFSKEIEKYIPPAKTRGHVLRLIREVLTFKPAHKGTSLKTALEHLNRVQRRRSVVFLLSDFLDSGYEKALQIAEKKHDLVAIHIKDPWETTFPSGFNFFIEDIETNEMGLVNTKNYSFSQKNGLLNKNREKYLSQVFRKLGTDSIPVETGKPYIESFLQFFASRAKRFR